MKAWVSNLKAIFLKKDSSIYLLFIAAFFTQFSFIVESLLFNFYKKPLSPLLLPLFYIISFILFYIFLSVYMKNRFTEENKMNNIKYLLNKLLPVLSSFVIMAFLFLVSNYAYKLFFYLYPFMLKSKVIAIGIIGVSVIFGLLIVSTMLSAMILLVTCYKYDVTFYKIGFAYFTIVSKMLKKILSVVVFTVLFIMFIYLINYIQSTIMNLGNSLINQGFLKNYIFFITATIFTTFALCFVANYADLIIGSFNEKEILRITNKQGLKVPIFTILAVAFSFFMLFMGNPVTSDPADDILAQIDSHMKKGDSYSAIGTPTKAIYEYNMAYSKTLCFKGYLQGLKANKTGAEDYSIRAYKDLEAANAASPKNPYTAYFKGKLLYNDKNPKGALEQYEIALSYKENISDTYFDMLKIYSEENNKEQQGKVIDILLNLRTFYSQYGKLDNLSEKKVDKYIEKLEKIEKSIGPKMAYKAKEKAKYNDYEGSQKDLLALEKLYPEDPIIAYYLSQNYNELKNEQSNYENVQKYTEQFSSNYEAIAEGKNQVERDLYTAEMYITTNDLGAAETLLEKLYNENKTQLSIVEEYGYLLNKTQKYDKSISVTEDMLSKKPDTVSLLYLKAEALLNKMEYDKSLECMVKIKNIASKDKANMSSLDKYLYNYSLSFSKALQDENAVKSLNNISNETVVYNYINAVKGWKDKDSTKSNEFIEKVIAENSNLGYAHFINGINYYEEAVRKSTNDFSKAEKAYLKSLDILPSHAEGYFSLGHCYKKAGKNLEALRAFRKTVYLMPYEDHRYDPYGITAHAQMEVSQLSKYEGE